MKYTDGYFKFPIRVYDPISVRDAYHREEKEGEIVDGNWLLGFKRVHPDDIESWEDTFTRDILPLNEESECNATVVVIKGEGEIMCTWNRKKFEEKLDAFHDAFDQEIRRMVEDECDEDTPDHILD
jgi:hypothetical protein